MQAVLLTIGAGVFACVFALGVMKALDIIRAKVGANNEGDNT
jgi:hypothetical protein